ncbi:hypothetical protein ARAM_003257 [Aspergillus rambellii]|uniref:DUF202 domain-containing protein n=1 Tax=Aspergillus rambellii TaxID=308745 RepID=A0A0F8VGI1_9EURO|nr:hypothetical protein ARAM_003257 [Aspergillus rambellii]
MDQCDLIPPPHANTRNVGASSPAHRSSSLQSSYNEPRRMSPFSTPHQATLAPGHGLSVNEITPIVRNSSSHGRQYNSTQDGPRSQDAGPPPQNGQLKSQSRRGSATASRENSRGDSAKHKASWYARITDKYGSLELENKGSVARDHLALERTFLAWLRTSLAFASIGIAVTQLFRLSNTTTESTNSKEVSSQSIPQFLSPTFSGPGTVRITNTSERLRSIGKPLGTTFIGVAIMILLVGFHRYFESQYWIIRGKFPASRGSIALISFLAGALIIAALAVILAISPGAVES